MFDSPAETHSKYITDNTHEKRDYAYNAKWKNEL